MRGGTRTIRNLPIPTISTGAEFERKWDFKLLSAHGSLIPGKYTRVPENTYVIFNSTCGCRSIITGYKGVPYEDLLYNSSKSDFFTNLLNEIRRPRGLMKTYTNVSNKHLINSFSETLISNYSTSCPVLTEEQISRAIYTPGSEIHDLDLSFENNAKGPILMGVFNMPLNPEIKERLEMFPIGTKDPKVIKNFDDATFGLKSGGFSGNILEKWIGKKGTLSRVFELSGQAGHALEMTKPNRFIFITACRGAEGLDPATRLTYTKLVRRNSVGKRINAPAEIRALGLAARERIRRMDEEVEAAGAGAGAGAARAAVATPAEAAAEAARGGAGTGNTAVGAGTTTRVANE